MPTKLPGKAFVLHDAVQAPLSQLLLLRRSQSGIAATALPGTGIIATPTFYGAACSGLVMRICCGITLRDGVNDAAGSRQPKRWKSWKCSAFFAWSRLLLIFMQAVSDVMVTRAAFIALALR